MILDQHILQLIWDQKALLYLILIQLHLKSVLKEKILKLFRFKNYQNYQQKKFLRECLKLFKIKILNNFFVFFYNFVPTKFSRNFFCIFSKLNIFFIFYH